MHSGWLADSICWPYLYNSWTTMECKILPAAASLLCHWDSSTCKVLLATVTIQQICVRTNSLCCWEELCVKSCLMDESVSDWPKQEKRHTFEMLLTCLGTRNSEPSYNGLRDVVLWLGALGKLLISLAIAILEGSFGDDVKWFSCVAMPPWRSALVVK